MTAMNALSAMMGALQFPNYRCLAWDFANYSGVPAPQTSTIMQWVDDYYF